MESGFQTLRRLVLYYFLQFPDAAFRKHLALQLTASRKGSILRNYMVKFIPSFLQLHFYFGYLYLDKLKEFC